MKTYFRPFSNKGVAIETAMFMMVVVFSLCTMLVMFAMISRRQNMKSNNHFVEYAAVDQIGEDFRARVAGYDPSGGESFSFECSSPELYRTFCEITDEGNYKLTLREPQLNTILLSLEVEKTPNGADIVRWSYYKELPPESSTESSDAESSAEESSAEESSAEESSAEESSAEESSAEESSAEESSAEESSAEESSAEESSAEESSADESSVEESSADESSAEESSAEESSAEESSAEESSAEESSAEESSAEESSADESSAEESSAEESSAEESSADESST